eukprot:747104-Hanusia_phi.AAC.1
MASAEQGGKEVGGREEEEEGREREEKEKESRVDMDDAGAKEGKVEAEEGCVIVGRTIYDKERIENKVKKGEQDEQVKNSSELPQTSSGIWKYLPGNARNAFPALWSKSPKASSASEEEQVSEEIKHAAPPLKFLGRDEWMCLIPLRVVAQLRTEREGPQQRFEVVSEGGFQLHVSGAMHCSHASLTPDLPAGKKQGTIEVGDWTCRLYGGWGATLSERLFRFYSRQEVQRRVHLTDCWHTRKKLTVIVRFCPEKLGNVEKLAVEFGEGNEPILNSMLLEAYGADLSSINDESFSGGCFIARVRRILPLTFLCEGVRDANDEECVCSITFPTPMRKRSRFIESLQEQLSRACDYRSEVDPAAVEAALQIDEIAVDGWDERLPGLIVNYAESSVPEKTGPLRVDEEGKSYYGVRIEAGGHQLASGLRTGSTWVAGQMVRGDVKAARGTDAFSKWIGPAAEEAKVSPGVQKALTYAQQGTEKLVDISCDIIGGLANIAGVG